MRIKDSKAKQFISIRLGRWEETLGMGGCVCGGGVSGNSRSDQAKLYLKSYFMQKIPLFFFLFFTVNTHYNTVLTTNK